MDPISTIIGISGVALAGLALVQNRREAAKRAEGDREHEQRQIEFNQPDLVPAGASLVQNDYPCQLRADGTEQSVDLHNTGKSTPRQVYGVLFPSARYFLPGESSAYPDKGLGGTYWQGKLDVAPAADGLCKIKLERHTSPLRGGMSVIGDHTLFAPPQPDIHEAIAQTPFYFARLTLTYRDGIGRVLGVAYDCHAVTMEWKWVAGPVGDYPRSAHCR